MKIAIACDHGALALKNALIPHLEDGQVIHIFADNFACLLLRRLMRDMGCTKRVIVGGWSSAPYGTRIETIGKFQFPHVGVKYRAIPLRGAALPMTDTDDFLESAKYLPCMDAVTQGDGAVKANTVLEAIALQRVTFPFGQRMYNLNRVIVLFLDSKSNRTLYTV